MTAPPVVVAAPPEGVPPLPLVCDSPHSGTTYPGDFGHAIDRAALRRSEDTDVHVLWDAVPAAGGTLVCANFPRSYIDANRDEADIDNGMLERPWPHALRPLPRSLALGIGLVWRETPQRQAIYARKLSVAEVERRIGSCWRPYRAALAQQLEAAARRHGGYWHLNLHSMPSNAYERLNLPATKRLADVVLGDRHGTSCGAEWRDAVAHAFRSRGYSVAINDPYEGVELVRLSGAPQQGRHSLQVELNRALYMDERTRERSEGFETLRGHIGEVVGELARFVQSQPKGRDLSCSIDSSAGPPPPSP